MATSSIFAPVVIQDPNVAEKIADGLDSIGKQTDEKLGKSSIPLCSDRNEIRKFMEERKKKFHE